MNTEQLVVCVTGAGVVAHPYSDDARREHHACLALCFHFIFEMEPHSGSTGEMHVNKKFSSDAFQQNLARSARKNDLFCKVLMFQNLSARFIILSSRILIPLMNLFAQMRLQLLRLLMA